MFKQIFDAFTNLLSAAAASAYEAHEASASMTPSVNIDGTQMAGLVDVEGKPYGVIHSLTDWMSSSFDSLRGGTAFDHSTGSMFDSGGTSSASMFESFSSGMGSMFDSLSSSMGSAFESMSSSGASMMESFSTSSNSMGSDLSSGIGLGPQSNIDGTPMDFGIDTYGNTYGCTDSWSSSSSGSDSWSSGCGSDW